MRRGTTPTIKFSVPYAADDIKGGFITFVQRGRVVLDKSLEDSSVTVSDKSISMDFTQKETLDFTIADRCKVQLRLILSNGKRVASQIVEFPVDEILKDGEI